MTLYEGAHSLPVRSSQDVSEEATRKLWRNEFGPAAFDQNAPFSSILLSGSGTTPAERKSQIFACFPRENFYFTFILQNYQSWVDVTFHIQKKQCK